MEVEYRGLFLMRRYFVSVGNSVELIKDVYEVCLYTHKHTGVRTL